MAQPEVNTLYGRLRGSLQKSIEGFNFYAFKGVPYAKPPVRELRFQDPVLPEPWTGTRDALEFGPICAQFDIVTKFMGGSDDCLYLNVYTKSVKPNVLQPVMIWIHGGGFIFGSGNDLYYGADYLLKKDVVLVTINYRLGILGFLNLENEVAPGNQGLKDQVMALQWVRDNIANFGGDPENVTIFGESAGGASVHYLTMSPLAKGLFHKAISQSGVALNPWASMPGDPKTYAYELCAHLGKQTKDPKEIVKFLQNVDSVKLIESQLKNGESIIPITCECPFGPGVDDKSPKPFMPVSRELAAEKGAHVPYLIGYTNFEGLFIYKSFQQDDFDIRNSQIESFLNPHTLDMLKKNNLTPNDLKYLYFKNEKISKDNVLHFVELIGDMLFVQDIHKVVKTQVERNSAPTYMYQFTYDDGVSLPKLLFKSQILGATHMEELSYIFSMKIRETLKAEPLKKGTIGHRKMEQMVELWTNFAKTGRPTLTISELVPVYWKPVIDGTVLRYLNIGEYLHMEKVLNIEERFSFKKDEDKI